MKGEKSHNGIIMGRTFAQSQITFPSNFSSLLLSSNQQQEMQCYCPLITAAAYIVALISRDWWYFMTLSYSRSKVKSHLILIFDHFKCTFLMNLFVEDYPRATQCFHTPPLQKSKHLNLFDFKVSKYLLVDLKFQINFN